jgi:hypothetical protein
MITFDTLFSKKKVSLSEEIQALLQTKIVDQSLKPHS